MKIIVIVAPLMLPLWRYFITCHCCTDVLPTTTSRLDAPMTIHCYQLLLCDYYSIQLRSCNYDR